MRGLALSSGVGQNRFMMRLHSLPAPQWMLAFARAWVASFGWTATAGSKKSFIPCAVVLRKRVKTVRKGQPLFWHVRLCFLLFSFFVTASVVVAAVPRTLYVDAARGDDAHDGLKPETAWQSLAKVSRAPLGPGDRVLFRRGQIWRGQLIPGSGDPQGDVTYGAFGEGAKPILLGSAAADRQEDWLQTGPGLWATVPLKFEAIGVPADLQQGPWALHHEGGASCTLVCGERQG